MNKSIINQMGLAYILFMLLKKQVQPIDLIGRLSNLVQNIYKRKQFKIVFLCKKKTSFNLFEFLQFLKKFFYQIVTIIRNRSLSIKYFY